MERSTKKQKQNPWTQWSILDPENTVSLMAEYLSMRKEKLIHNVFKFRTPINP